MHLADAFIQSDLLSFKIYIFILFLSVHDMYIYIHINIHITHMYIM